MTNELAKKIVFLSLFSTLSYLSFAHGYIEKPGSRNYYCGVVTSPSDAVYGNPVYKQCTEVFKLPDGKMNNDGYNFMSIVTHTTGRKGIGGSSSHDQKSLPQNVCGFDSEKFAPITNNNPLGRGKTLWDNPIDWPTSAMSAGTNEFIWNIAYGPHFSDTEQFRYWITKPDFKFQVGKPLAWSDLEAAPFCEIAWNGQNTSAIRADYEAQKFHMFCNVPSRQGRHIIYGEWGRNSSTYERFHSCMDVVFGGSSNIESTVSVPVEAKIMLEPSIDKVYGSASVVLNGGTSSGNNISYQWSISSEHPELYVLQNANQIRATLVMANPNAQGNVVIKLSVGNGNNHNDTTKTIVHIPSSIGQWFDLGQITRQAKILIPGDRVWVRTVLKDGHDVYYPINGLTITSENYHANEWTYALANEINKQNGDLMLGIYSNSKIEPIKHETENRMFAKSSSSINSSYLVIQSGITDTSGNTGSTDTAEDNTGSTFTAQAAATSSSGGGCSAVVSGDDYSLILLVLFSICYAYYRRRLKIKNSLSK